MASINASIYNGTMLSCSYNNNIVNHTVYLLFSQKLYTIFAQR